MRTLQFPKCCVVCCKKCGHDVLSGSDSFPATAISVVCSLCGERRRYLPSEVIHGRPHGVVRRKKAVARDGGPLSPFGSLVRGSLVRGSLVRQGR